MLIVLAMLVALAFGGLGALIGARTGSAEAVQGMFPLLFVTFFLSSMNLPRNLIASRLVPHGRDLEPGLLPGRGAAQPGHHRLGRDRAVAGFGRRGARIA